MTKSGTDSKNTVYCWHWMILAQDIPNLRCLSDLKPAYIKIDRSFTLKALNREYEYRLLNHIVEMSHSLGLHVCVEGIETEGELTKAKQTEPDYIQGFLFGKPCSRAEFTQKFFTKQAG